MPSTETKPLTPRLFAKCRRCEETGCLVWQGAKRRGYGEIRHERVRTQTNRAAWFVYYGEYPPDGVQVCHTCDNRACVEKEHLFLGTAADNMADKVQKNRQAKGERNGQARLTAEQAAEIKERVANGEVQRRLAAEFGVSTTAVYFIVNGKKWGGALKELASRAAPN